MIKRACCVVALALSIAAVGAQERIAVLDTVLPKGIDAKVVIPITEKIMEEFVRSKLFTVLDRSYITKTLSELEFSTSDLTSGDSEKLATIGGFLKASYIVVSTVQQLESTYFLSAKMIEVKTGVITAQTSVNRSGGVAVLIDMAGDLGRQLVAASMGQDVGSTSRSGGRVAVQPTQSTAPSSAPPPEPEPATEPRRKPARFSSVTADVGSAATIATEAGTEFDIYSEETGSYSAAPGFSYGVSAVMPAGLFYLSAALAFTDTEVDEYSYYLETSTIGAHLGLGIDIPIAFLQLYGGARVGYFLFDEYMEIYVGDYAGSYLEETWGGFAYGLEIGADARLGRLVVGLRYTFDMGTISEVEGDWADIELETGSLSLRAGFAF